ncbi:YicC/YloC family endoribonuclease [Legionella spiritensis]|uniref:YicC/YloC family endoribonuclease n=1 Tax=Legionella spiritensis TaxID=452 RepID=UPI000F6E5D1F|nr:YicC/YloC family endoribonuclease [Legionella spiritensis]VEG92315.1 putative stress-induced protein [Legionella spiritensis]
MIYSMTAFARSQTQFNETTICWELRSVNHRYLDISFRLPEAWRFLETELRNQLRGQCHRGKIECQLKITDGSSDSQSLAINYGMVHSLLHVGEELAVNKHLANDLTLSGVLSWPGVVQCSPVDMDGIREQVKMVFQQALQQLIVSRAEEGKSLESHLQSRLQLMHEEVDKAKSQASFSIAELRDKMLTRLHALQLDTEHPRVEQEIALMLTRLDVSEELDRLNTHLLEVARVLSDTEVMGRRLDFLMQELNREANTLGSKSESTALTSCVIEMKVLIEQMREQIQNIE